MRARLSSCKNSGSEENELILAKKICTKINEKTYKAKIIFNSSRNFAH